MNDNKYDDNVQHGIDDDPNNDPEKARNIGGVGGAVTGAIAGAAAGPVGALVGGAIGAVVGGLGSQAAVSAVDKVDNDNTVTGLGHGATGDPLTDDNRAYADNPTYTNSTEARATYGNNDGLPGNGVPGVQTGGTNADGSPDTRGVTEKLADGVTGDKIDDKTGKRV